MNGSITPIIATATFHMIIFVLFCFPPPLFLQNKLKLDMKEFESDFERMHQFLIGEQALLLHQLEDRYELLLARQSGNVSRLEEQGAALSRLIAEAEDKSKQDGLQLLKVNPFPTCLLGQVVITDFKEMWWVGPYSLLRKCLNVNLHNTQRCCASSPWQTYTEQLLLIRLLSCFPSE